MGEVERLADDGVNEVFFSGWWSGGWTITRYQNNFQAGPIFPNQSSSFPAVHFGHGEIGEDKIKITSLQFFNRLLTASRQFDTDD